MVKDSTPFIGLDLGDKRSNVFRDITECCGLA